MMTPQLFINYKLKSVAHLPWRMMSYKFLNTFIDDIFAFVIKMPTMYRIGCLRDGKYFGILLSRFVSCIMISTSIDFISQMSSFSSFYTKDGFIKLIQVV